MEDENYTYDYFISYRRACGGALEARHVKSILCKYGKTAFLDVDDIKAGYEYEPQIYSAIENSKDFILILNEESWREKETIDIYYNEIIKITKQDGKIVPIEFAKDVLKSIPDGEGCVLYKQLNRNIKKFEKVSYSHDEHFLFEKLFCDKLGLPYSPDSQIEKLPHFSMPFQIEDLIKRDEKVDALCEEIIKHRIFNRVGIGGIGKTTLSYLLAERYKTQFSNIAYVVVNGNIKEDFVSQINDNTLKFNFAQNETTEDKYKKIISFMGDNYKTGNNLLILDVNETAEKSANEKFVEEIKKFPDNWRILILSRENFGSFPSKNINDEDDNEFLKKLFLSKAGARYNNFDFDRLFKLIWYNSLLAEQLGFYLKYLPVQTFDEIKNILCKDILDEDIEGVNALGRQKKLKEFLKNLIKIQDFNEEQQKLLRHFVLWESKFIGYNIICDLLKGVCDNINKTLVSLAKRSILSFDETKSAYKLHGLLADSLREQIDVTKQDYETYFNNIRRIRDYNFREFLPYADCIGNSLCEYEITTRFYFLNGTATKFHKTWKTDYAKRLYEKCIKISETKLKTEPKDVYRLEDLSNAYNNLAILQVDQLSAENNYNKAIEIDKRILQISDTLGYQNSLAAHYNNLAVLQKNHLDNPKSAETNFNEAIKIQEKITQQSDDPEYLNDLARTYYNLALLQKDSLNDSASAEENYNKAIEIGERIRKTDNPKSEYLNQLAKAYINLAVIQNNRKDYDAAKRNLEEAIKIKDSITNDNIEYLVDWLLSKCNYADILIATGNPDAARGIINEIKPIVEEWVEKIPNYDYLKMVYGAIKDTESDLNQ